jgi:enoyl-CoA hydratase
LEFLNVTTADYVATISLNNPPANVLARKVLLELQNVFQSLKDDSEVRVVLLKGEGRFFSAGADIKEFTIMGEDTSFDEITVLGQNVLEDVENFPKPVIVAIHGAALGGGLELSMACHIRLVAENAKLGLPELQLGLIPGYGGTIRLANIVGSAKAAELMFTSDHISGEEAYRLGLANQVYPQEKLHDNALELAKRIALKSPNSLKAVIEMLNRHKDASYAEALRKESQGFGKCYISQDGREGVNAFLEKRMPVFKGE